MPSDQDVFTEQTTNQQPAQPQDPTVNPLDEFVGEGKKYKTVEDFANAFVHSQNHIANLESENQGYRESISEYEERIASNKAVLEAAKNRQTQNQPAPISAPIDDEDLETKIDRVFERRTKAQIEQENQDKANSWAFDTFGDDAPKKITEAATKLGVNVDFLRQTASTSVEAFKRLVNENTESSEPVVTGASPKPSSTPTSPTSSSQVKNYAYYKQMRQDNPTLFKSMQIQKEMMQMRGQLGEKAFYNK